MRPTTSGDPIQARDHDVLAALLIDAIENMAEAFVLWDAHDRLVLCNERYAQRFADPAQVRPGIRFCDLVDMNIRAGSVKQLDGIADADRHPDLYRQHRMRLHRDGDATGEVLSHDGRWYQFRERRTRSGGVVGLYADITDRKHAEARARDAQCAAEQANLAKSRFLAAASHDLRQPLHAMGIFLSVLEHRLTDPAALEVLTDLQECALALGGLFDSLLDISKLDAGVLQPDPRPVDLGPLLAAVRREYGPLAERRGLRFRVVPTRLRVQTDPAMLGRILRNFCSNAVKYTREGGVVVGVRRQGADIRIDVADTGIGFPPERIDDVFQEFHRLPDPDPDPDQGQQGLGLGLAIASRLAETLAADDTPAIVLTHVPLGGGSMAGNYYFDANPHMATYPEHADIRRVIENSRRVALCLAGHVHWNSVQTVDAVPYLTVQSLTESFTTPGQACGAWADLDIRADRVSLRVAGLDSLDMTIPLRAPVTRWTPRMSPMPRSRDRRGRTDAPLDLNGVAGLILDLDGVLYRGAEAIPDAPAFLDALTARGLPYVLLTNNARATAMTAAIKLKDLGMPVPADRIVTAGWATCRGLGARGRHRVRVFGPATLHAEARAAGLDIDPGAQTPDAVLVGYDPALRAGDLAEAAHLVRAGAALVATNPDATIPGVDGLDPECGALVAFLETATGRRAEIGGKPSRDIVHRALERLGLPAPGVLMVGDTLETDIAGAVAAGLRSVLVTTGNNAPLDEIDGAPMPAPTAHVASLTDLLDRLGPPTERVAG